MNIFALDTDPFVAAAMHCDKHVVKMIVEYAQLLSTAHRVLDGTPIVAVDEAGRTGPKVFRLLRDEEAYIDGNKWCIRNRVAYNMTHANHPAAVWARASRGNYWWLLRLFVGCLNEYTIRYGKVHASDRLFVFLKRAPKNIVSREQSAFPQTMPEEYQVPNDPVLAYQNFYLGSKIRFAKYTTRSIPDWFTAGIIERGLNVSDFQRTRSFHKQAPDRARLNA